MLAINFTGRIADAFFAGTLTGSSLALGFVLFLVLLNWDER